MTQNDNMVKKNYFMTDINETDWMRHVKGGLPW